MMETMDDYVATAHALADAAGAIARDAWFGAAETTFKADGSALTSADTDIEARLRATVRARHPDHGILGEEFGAVAGSGAFTWVIDPIDGTRQFGARLMNWGVLIALCRDGEPVLGVVDQPLALARYLGVEGRGATLNGRPIRVSGREDLSSASIALANPLSFGPAERGVFDRLAGAVAMASFDGGCLAYGALARGRVDLVSNGPDLEPFDICALVPIVREAGGVLTAWDGRAPDLSYAGPIVAAASAALHREALALIGAER
ncbi:MAG: inositol monophosphatase family protein [Pseudomonadota bacterium]